MGMDIHMHIIRETEVVREDIFDGRSSEWFNNLMGHGDDDEYDYLPVSYGLPDTKPEVVDDYILSEMEENKDGYFGFRHISVIDFKNWFEKYRPDLQAGWATTYEKWQIENKGYIPEYLPHFLDNDMNPNDYHFVEYTNKWDCSRWLYNFLNDNKDIREDDVIIYWFDW